MEGWEKMKGKMRRNRLQRREEELRKDVEEGDVEVDKGVMCSMRISTAERAGTEE